MSRDKLFHAENGPRASSLSKYTLSGVVRVAVSQSKCIEMGLKGIEMS